MMAYGCAKPQKNWDQIICTVAETSDTHEKKERERERWGKTEMKNSINAFGMHPNKR
jgi:hypothetical protein